MIFDLQDLQSRCIIPGFGRELNPGRDAIHTFEIDDDAVADEIKRRRTWLGRFTADVRSELSRYGYTQLKPSPTWGDRHLTAREYARDFLKGNTPDAR